MTEKKNSLDPALRCRILRYLYTGNEVPKYYPGCWEAHNYFKIDKLTALNEALTNDPNNTEVINLIVKVAKDGMYTRFEPIAFALAKCLLLGTPTIKEATYNAAAEICVTSEQMLLFQKFSRLFKTGNGRGWCKNVIQWYTNKKPMDLIKEITRVRGRYGRTHKTLLRKSHIKVPENDFLRDAIVKYAIFGLKRAKQLMGDKPGTSEIFEYIQKVEDLRHCEDPPAAAEMIVKNKFVLDHIPGHLLTTQEVWEALLPHFTLPQLLHHLQRMHNMAFLSGTSTLIPKLLTLLNNQDYIQSSDVTPLHVYIAKCDYRLKTRPMRHEKAKVAAEKEQRRRSRQIYDSKTGLWEWTTTRRHPKELKNWGIDKPPNPLVLASLSKLVDQTWCLTPPTKKRYLITMDMRHHMFKGRHFCKSYTVPKKGKLAANKATALGSGDTDTEKKSKKHLLAECFYNKHITPGHAAILMALQLLKREKDVKLAVFSEEGIEFVSIERNFTNMEEAEFVLRKANLGRVQLDAPIEWAAKSNVKFDVFINMVDRVTRYMELDQKDRGGRGPGGRFGPPPSPEKNLVDHCPVRALQRYRKTSGVKDAKLIVMNLASHRVSTTDGSHEGVLDVVGVDKHVPQLIDAFALGHFY